MILENHTYTDKNIMVNNKTSQTKITIEIIQQQKHR